MSNMLVFFFKLQKLTPPLHEYSNLELMLALRKMGWSYTALADKFSVEKTTIRYICRKFGLAGEVETKVLRNDPNATTVYSQNTYTKEVINPGKMYAEYIQDAKQRKWKKLIQGNINHS